MRFRFLASRVAGTYHVPSSLSRSAIHICAGLDLRFTPVLRFLVRFGRDLLSLTGLYVGPVLVSNDIHVFQRGFAKFDQFIYASAPYLVPGASLYLLMFCNNNLHVRVPSLIYTHTSLVVLPEHSM